jgi:hypothetical protein
MKRKHLVQLAGTALIAGILTIGVRLTAEQLVQHSLDTIVADIPKD